MNETNAERLERIKKRQGEVKDHRLGSIHSGDVDWLIEQVDRAQELEKLLKDYQTDFQILVPENKQLREALEFYAKERNHKPDQYGETMIEIDGGERARHIIEGVSNDQIKT